MTSRAAKPQDLSARIAELEAELADERRAREDAEEISRAATARTATVSHEIRTAVGAITAMADLLLASELDSVQTRYADTLLQSSRCLLTVLNDILDFSKLDSGRFKVETIAFDTAKFAKSIRTALTAQTAEKGLVSKLILSKDCPKHLVGDPARLRQVMNNLISNAVKFTPNGSVQVTIGFEEDGDDRLLRCEVADTGIGLSKDQQVGLFQPYGQSDGSIAAKYGGTGLGLSIARKLAGLMGGELGMESVLGEGSTFWFTARVGQPAGEHAKPQSKLRKPAMSGPLSGHALIVEDNSVNQTLIAAYLDRFGVTYEMAANGRQAVEAVKERPFDVILMDVMMPEMDGIEATSCIRALDEPHSLVPIIALTANAMRGDRESYLAAGMDGYVSKPMDAGALLKVLAEQLPSADENELVRNTG